FDSLGHRHGHAAVLEGTGGIQAFELDIDVDIPAQQRGNVLQLYKRRIAFAKANDASCVADRQAVAKRVDQTSVTGSKRHTYRRFASWLIQMFDAYPRQPPLNGVQRLDAFYRPVHPILRDPVSQDDDSDMANARRRLFLQDSFD